VPGCLKDFAFNRKHTISEKIIIIIIIIITEVQKTLLLILHAVPVDSSLG
jgi:hypothetical protein